MNTSLPSFRALFGLLAVAVMAIVLSGCHAWGHHSHHGLGGYHGGHHGNHHGGHRGRLGH